MGSPSRGDGVLWNPCYNAASESSSDYRNFLLLGASASVALSPGCRAVTPRADDATHRPAPPTGGRHEHNGNPTLAARARA
jgi:hypothetical protein